MRIYGVPFNGSVFVEAASPEQALAKAQKWSESVLRASVTEESLPCGESIGIIIIKPQDGPICDATDQVNGMPAEARREG